MIKDFDFFTFFEIFIMAVVAFMALVLWIAPIVKKKRVLKKISALGDLNFIYDFSQDNVENLPENFLKEEIGNGKIINVFSFKESSYPDKDFIKFFPVYVKNVYYDVIHRELLIFWAPVLKSHSFTFVEMLNGNTILKSEELGNLVLKGMLDIQNGDKIELETEDVLEKTSMKKIIDPYYDTSFSVSDCFF